MKTRHDDLHVWAGHRVLAANAAVVLLESDGVIELESTDAAAKAVTMTALTPDTMIEAFMHTRSSTGTYTLACNRGATSGNVTLDAAGEGCKLRRVGAVWRLIALYGGATFA